MKKKKLKIKKSPEQKYSLPPPVVIQYLDLSSDLDHRLRFIGSLIQHLDPDQTHENPIELGYIIIEYLGKRAVLEHVFLGRYLNHHSWEDPHLKSEAWRLQKIKARAALLAR